MLVYLVSYASFLVILTGVARIVYVLYTLDEEVN
jgi:hypothetical protein